VVREVAPQSLGTIMDALGYAAERLEPLAHPQPAPVERRTLREPLRAPRRPPLARMRYSGRERTGASASAV
jgi:hypothetical protein